jgi:hypothetical protein
VTREFRGARLLWPHAAHMQAEVARDCLPLVQPTLPVLDLLPACTCSVCPFYSSRADIVPSQYVNPTWAAYPPKPEKLGELYELVRT